MVDAVHTGNGWQAQCRCGWRSDFGTESEMETARTQHREHAHGIIDETPEYPNVTITTTMPNVTANDLVSSEQAAQIIGITLNNLRQLVFKKKLTVARKDGRKTMFYREDVTRLAASRNATHSPV